MLQYHRYSDYEDKMRKGQKKDTIWNNIFHSAEPTEYRCFHHYFIISLPAGYLFGFILDWGLTGIWLSFPFGLTSAGVMFYLRFRKQIR